MCRSILAVLRETYWRAQPLHGSSYLYFIIFIIVKYLRKQRTTPSNVKTSVKSHTQENAVDLHTVGTVP